MLVRYAMLVTMTASAIWGLIVVSNSNGGQMLLADAGQGGTPGSTSFWLLASVATLVTLSLFRFVIFGLPSMVDAWLSDKRTWGYAVFIGGLIYGVFYLSS